MRFLDANVFAYAFYNNNHAESCQNALREGGLTDAFALAEAFHIIEMETSSRETAQKAIRSLLKLNITVIPVDVNLIFETMKASGKTKMNVFDCIHYACIKLCGCDSILTYDKGFDDLDISREEP